LRRLITRRRVLGALASLAGLSLLEYESLSGKWDHARIRPATAAEAWAKAMARLVAEPALAAGAMVHVGHSTHLLSIAGVRLLTDPWFDDPAFGAMAHAVGPAVRPEGLGPLGAILVTHDHADHADMPAMDRMDKRAAAIVATAGLAAKAKARGFTDVRVLAPWESTDVGAAKVTAVPAEHDVYEIGFVVEGAGRSVYFAGDSRLFPGIAAIGERFRPTAAILPVDGTRLRGGPLQVMRPEDAVEAARTLGSKLVFPSHAESYFSDPLAGHVIATHVAGANAAFAALARERLPGVQAKVPAPAEVCPLPV
jgi:L-ascorbate metabolism protein UlaG (beta-lactamase superfamily)